VTKRAKKLERKCIITISGVDGSDDANVSVEFDPPVDDSNGKTRFGFNSMVVHMLDALTKVQGTIKHRKAS